MAVKIVAHNCALSSLAEVLRESALSTSITHPNVVRAVRLAAEDHHSHVHLISSYTAHCPATLRAGVEVHQWLYMERRPGPLNR